MKPKLCAWCELPFTPHRYHKTQKFCSLLCMGRRNASPEYKKLMKKKLPKLNFILRGSYNIERTLQKCKTCPKVGYWSQCYTCCMTANYIELLGGGYKQKYE